MTLLARLDYDNDEILMIAETEVEKTKRVGACAKECEWCGQPFEPRRRGGRPQRFCSKVCRRRGRPRRQSLDDRFFSKVYITSDCWWWTGAKNRQGYGQIGIGGRRTSGGQTPPAHRFGYEQMVGPVPQGLDLDHLCRNKSCVRPDHLEPVTRSENCRRSPLIGRWPRR